MIIFEADDPLVLNGTYDREGYTPAERRAQWRREAADLAENLKTNRKDNPMRLFDQDHVGCYLDSIDHRVERDGETETKMVDLTLRVQPLTPELATMLDPDVRNFLFTLRDAAPKPKLKAVHFDLTYPRQLVVIHLLPETEGQITFTEVEITGIRVRTEKGVDGFALVFYASFGPPSPRDLEYVCDWHTQQRFVTFQPQEPTLDFAAKEPTEGPEPVRHISRRHARKQPPVEAGDELRPGVVAEH